MQIITDSSQYFNSLTEFIKSTNSNMVNFSDYSCNFVKGDGVGGTEQNIGNKPSPQACIDACVNKKKTNPEINGVTITPTGKGSCYCEKKMKNSNNSPSWKTCQLRHEDSKKVLSSK